MTAAEQERAAVRRPALIGSSTGTKRVAGRPDSWPSGLSLAAPPAPHRLLRSTAPLEMHPTASAARQSSFGTAPPALYCNTSAPHRQNDPAAPAHHTAFESRASQVPAPEARVLPATTGRPVTSPTRAMSGIGRGAPPRQALTRRHPELSSRSVVRSLVLSGGRARPAGSGGDHHQAPSSRDSR